MRLKVQSTGSGLGLQDGGRPGWRRYGVPPGGAMDRHAMQAANRLLGNSPTAPVLEVQFQGAKLRVTEDCWLAIAGADCCPQMSAWTAGKIPAETVLEFSQQAQGIYAYLAVPGGFRAERRFGSVSVDPRNKLGTALTKGAVLQVGRENFPFYFNRLARRILPPEARRSYPAKQNFTLLRGPQFEAFTPEAREQLTSVGWRVSAQSDRTGFRLKGPTLNVPDSIPSEPVLPGSFQVPGEGQPIITMPDGPTVGGYPKIAILKEADRDRLAQCAPGTRLYFQWDGY